MATSTGIQPKARATLLIVGMIFGSAFLCVKILVGEMSPIQVAAWRLLLGGLAVSGVLIAQRRMPRLSWGLLGSVTVLALLDSVIPYTLIAWAETRIDSGVASVLLSTMPLFTAVFASALLPDERLSPSALAGLALGLSGVAVLAGRDSLNVASGVSFGHVAVVCAAISYGAGFAYARRLLAKQDATSLTAIKLMVGALIATAVAVAVDGSPIESGLSARAIAALLVLGVVSTGLARTLYFWVISSIGSVRASLVTYIVPVFALLLGWCVLGEEIGAGTLAGMTIIISGVALVMYGSALLRAVSRLRLGGLRVGLDPAPSAAR